MDYSCIKNHFLYVFHERSISADGKSHILLYSEQVVGLLVSTSSRFQKKNMILGVVWFSKDKPTMITYLKPLMASINELSYDGMCVICMHV